MFKVHAYYPVLLVYLLTKLTGANHHADGPMLDRVSGLPSGTWNGVFSSLATGCAYLPFALAYDVAQLSSLADELMEVLNEKSVQDIENEPLVRPLMNTLGNLNAGQGLGFKLLGTVADKNTLFRICSWMTGSLVTIVPIILSLRPDLNESKESATGGSTNSSTVCSVGELSQVLADGLDRMDWMDLMAMASSRAPWVNATCTFSHGSILCS